MCRQLYAPDGAIGGTISAVGLHYFNEDELLVCTFADGSIKVLNGCSQISSERKDLTANFHANAVLGIW